MWSFMKRTVYAVDAWVLAKHQSFLGWTQQRPMRMALNCSFGLAVVAVCRLFIEDVAPEERMGFSTTTLLTAIGMGWGSVLLDNLDADMSDMGAEWRIFWAILMSVVFVLGLLAFQPWRSAGAVCIMSMIYFSCCTKPPPRKRKEKAKEPLMGHNFQSGGLNG